jgi:glycosyltransferase involved in cell wall biosynthesis
MTHTVVVDLTPLDTPSRARGIGRYVATLARGLENLPQSERQGIRLLGLTHLHWSGRHQVTEDLSSFDGSPSIRRPSKKDYRTFTNARRLGLWRALRELGADLVHLTDPNATPLRMGASGCRRLVTCHDLIPLLFPDRYLNLSDGLETLGTKIIQRRFRSADHILAISDATKGDLERLVGVPSRKISRVYNGVDISAWKRMAQQSTPEVLDEYGLRDLDYVLFVGDTDWRKNTESMVQAVAKARGQGADVHLVFAGRLAPKHEARLRKLAARTGVGDNVIPVGYVPDDRLAALYRGAVAHLLVSRSEGFGLTVVEAMACGCPVITTSEGSLPEVAGDAALQVPAEDTSRIADAIVLLVRDKERREQLRIAGAKRAPLFDVAPHARATMALYREVLGGSLGSAPLPGARAS